MHQDLIETFERLGVRDVEITEDVDKAVERITAIYEAAVERLRAGPAPVQPGRARPRGRSMRSTRSSASQLEAGALNLDGRLAYGALHDPGVYGATLTHPRLFARLLPHPAGAADPQPWRARSRPGSATGRSRCRSWSTRSAAACRRERLHELQYLFPMPDLSQTDDAIANGTWRAGGREPAPLALVHRRARRLQPAAPLSLYRHASRVFPALRAADQLPALCRAFRRLRAGGGRARRAIRPLRRAGRCGELNPRLRDEPNSGTPLTNLPQMPAYHLTRPDGRGVTMINIGVGPSNARTITDHVAVLRPHCWLMLGHCAGLRRSQQLGDYVLAHGYVREDNVLDQEVPLFVPVPPIAEVQVALQEAVVNVTGLQGLRRQDADADRHGGDHRQPQLGAALRRAVRAPQPVAGRSRSTWRAPRSPPTASASACPTARCCASRTSRCMASSSCAAWPTPSTASGSTSICASAWRRSASCARRGRIACIHASCAASTSRRSATAPVEPGARGMAAGRTAAPRPAARRPAPARGRPSG